MTEEERRLIQGLADRIRSAPAPQIDRDADALIQQSFGARTDALYILTQTVLIQEMALNQAKEQIDRLKAEQPKASFLPNPPAVAPAPSRPAGAYEKSRYSGAFQAPPQPPPLPTQYVVVEQQRYGGRFSDFLYGAAQTAAGVVAGELAFSAVSSVFGYGYGYGGGGFFGGGGYYSPGSETIINNYYEDAPLGGPPAGGDFRGDDRRFDADSSGSDSSAPLEDDSSDNSSDDSSSDDSSSYDDASGSDDQ
jgi:hypothetical protein